jgi:hypothetical protein
MAHQTEPPPPLPASVPPPISEIVYAALSKDPRDRPPTAGEFGRRCLALADPAFTAAINPPTGATERLRTGTVPVVPVPIRQTPAPQPPPKRKIPVSVPLIGLLVLAAVLLTILLLRNSNNSGNATPSTSPSVTATSASPTPSETPTPSPSATESPSPSPSPTPQTVNLNPADYIGRTYSAVAASLSKKGFSVNGVGSVAPDAIVTGINPSGVQVVGAQISVFAQAPTPSVTPSPSETPSPSTGADGGIVPPPGDSASPGA